MGRHSDKSKITATIQLFIEIEEILKQSDELRAIHLALVSARPTEVLPLALRH
jgi:hypothetical protein